MLINGLLCKISWTEEIFYLVLTLKTPNQITALKFFTLGNKKTRYCVGLVVFFLKM